MSIHVLKPIFAFSLILPSHHFEPGFPVFRPCYKAFQTTSAGSSPGGKPEFNGRCPLYSHVLKADFSRFSSYPFLPLLHFKPVLPVFTRCAGVFRIYIRAFFFCQFPLCLCSCCRRGNSYPHNRDMGAHKLPSAFSATSHIRCGGKLHRCNQREPGKI